MSLAFLSKAALAAAVLFSASVTFAQAAPTNPDMHVFFGTNDSGPTRGIFVSNFDSKTGALAAPTLAIQTAAPSYLIVAPDAKHLYSVNEIGNYNGEQHMGSISSFSLDAKTGKLTLLNQKPSSGQDPCYISLDKTGKFILVANYTGNGVPGEGGTVAVYQVLPDGSFGNRTGFDQHKGTSIDPDRQKAAYAHSFFVDPTNHYALSCDLGLDKVFIYKFDQVTGAISPGPQPFANTKLGGGPRHGTFHPNGKFFYTSHEMGAFVTAFNWDADKGTLTSIQEISTMPDGYTGKRWTAEVRVTPDGKFLYVSNRGDDTIAQFSVGDDGKLTKIGAVPSGGTTPRNFEWDPTTQWLMASNQAGNNVMVFKRDLATGKLTPQGQAMSMTLPFCPRFVPIPK